MTLIKTKNKLAKLGLIGGALVMTLSLSAAAMAASDTASTIINASIASTISVSSTSPINLSITPTSGGSLTNGSDTVTVTTNSTSGYTLKLQDSDSTNTLDGPSSNTIAAGSGTFATPQSLAANTWGYRVDGATGSGFGAGPTTQVTDDDNSAGVKYAAVPTATGDTINETTGPSTSGSTTTVWYAAFVNQSKPSGTYTDTVTYTATTK